MEILLVTSNENQSVVLNRMIKILQPAAKIHSYIGIESIERGHICVSDKFVVCCFNSDVVERHIRMYNKEANILKRNNEKLSFQEGISDFQILEKFILG